MPRELPQKRCLVDSTHRNQKAAHFRQSVGYPGMGLRRSGEGRDLDVQVLEEMGVATVATAPQLLLLPPVSHRSASQNGHLAHGVLLQALHRVALGSEQLAHEIELLRRHKGKCNENVYPPLTGFQNRNRTHPPPLQLHIRLHTFGWSRTGTATLTATFTGLSRVMSSILSFSAGWETEKCIQLNVRVIKRVIQLYGCTLYDTSG